MSEYHCSTLENGLRVATLTMPHAATVAVSVGVDAGTRHETLAQHGISHMLEHMAFKGTPSRTAQQIAEQMDAVGGHLNAYTSMESTVYHARVLTEDAPFAVELLADILQHSTFDADELQREKQVIAQEIAMHHDTPDDVVFDRFTETAFPNQAVGRSILGTQESLARHSREDLQQYVDSHYTAERMVLVLTGNISHASALKLANAQFGALPASKPYTVEAGHYTAGEFREKKKLEQLHFLIGFPAASYRDLRRYRTQQLLASILGGGMSSRLFQEVREKQGLAYSIYAFASSYKDCGVFGIYAGTGAKDVQQLLDITARECHALLHSISDEELERAKTQFRAGLLMGAESVPNQCDMITRHLLAYGHYLDAKTVMSDIDPVTGADIQQELAQLLAEPPIISALGPIGTLPDYATIRTKMAV